MRYSYAHMKRWADSTDKAVGQHIHEEVAPATRVLGKAPKIVNHSLEGMANHTNTQDSPNQTTH